MMYRFQVYGVPQQKGSTRMIPVKRRLVITSDNPELRAWERTVAVAARVVARELVPPPVALDVEFRLPLTKALAAKLARHPAKHPPDGGQGQDIDGLLHTTFPDLDKLLRGVCDPLSGILFKDDKQIARMRATKRYARLGEAPGAVVMVYPL